MTAAPDLLNEAKESARAAQLRYVSDRRPGILRRGAGSVFSYLDPEGQAVQDEATLAHPHRNARVIYRYLGCRRRELNPRPSAYETPALTN